jgi:hypothetical protein
MSPHERLFIGRRGRAGDGGADDGAGRASRAGAGADPQESSQGGSGRGRLLGGIAVAVLLALIAIALLHTPGGLTGIAPGRPLAPFAVPLAKGTLVGDANTAVHAHEGESGNVPACSVRGSQVLNICELAERGPVVLALFVNGGECPSVLGEMQALKSSFPGVQFAAVEIKGSRAGLRTLIARKGLTFPVGIDADGALASLYKVLGCPQVDFAYPGGKVQSRALLVTPTAATLRARVAALVAAARARGWHGAAT